MESEPPSLGDWFVEGAAVVAADMSAPALQSVVADIVAGGGAAEAAILDLRDESASRLMIEGILARHQRIDVLVNNAGIFRGGNLLSLSEDDWRLSFSVNSMQYSIFAEPFCRG
nr:SDR family NAD(P)-dependent oxidoreductase [Bradyrhizobium canariense]